MKKLIRETAEEILQEYTNCYSEADEDCLVKMLENLSSNMAREIFENILKIKGLELHDWEAIAELKKKYESEGADDV